ncbi:hypothetical protein ACWIG4_30170 [Streptomyces sp. NPDC002248]
MGNELLPGEVSPYEPASRLGSNIDFSYLPEDDQKRALSYKKYEQMYFNDREQYPVRVLDGEEPIYVPNPRTIVDTTSFFLLKGLRVTPKDPHDPSGRAEQIEASGSVEDRGKPSSINEALKAFLDREMFYPRFHNAKHAGVARGDWCLHMTADPDAAEGSRISLNPVAPWKVILDRDPDDSTSVIRAHLVELIPHPDDPDKTAIKELVYDYGEDEDEATSPGVPRTVFRTETIWANEGNPWYEEGSREEIMVTLPREALPAPIDTIPVYWFNNINWDGELYGISELRGFESISRGISQLISDQNTALGLNGLGVYATDGGRPVDQNGNERDWEVTPGAVVEVPTGAYFRRVEGVGSVKPNMDHIEYLESKIREAGGLSDVALGRVDVQTAQSGIALAIKFMPTLSKTEERDQLGLGKLKQLFFDWKNWYAAYEGQLFEEEIVVTIGDKLPSNRTERVNELNNMVDRKIISRRFYRAEMQNLGYVFPDDIEDQIAEEAQVEAEQKAALAPPELQQNAIDAATGAKPAPPNPNQPGVKTERSDAPNQSNNASRPNESSGTEAHQPIEVQARGGKPLVATK